jgi:hypothetical protein
MNFILLLLKMVSEIGAETGSHHVITIAKLVSMNSKHRVPAYGTYKLAEDNMAQIIFCG